MDTAENGIIKMKQTHRYLRYIGKREKYKNKKKRKKEKMSQRKWRKKGRKEELLTLKKTLE